MEGPHLIEEALNAGIRLLWVLYAEGEGLSSALREACRVAGTECLPCAASLLRAASDLDRPRDLIAYAERPRVEPRTLLASCAHPGDWLLVAAGVQEPGNVGALARVAAGLGAVGFLALQGSAWPWSPRALRGSSGTVLRLPVAAGWSAEEFLAAAGESGIELWAADAHAAEDLRELRPRVPVALLLGEEGRGLPEDLSAAAHRRFRIPLARGVESLNVATAAAIFAWSLQRGGRE